MPVNINGTTGVSLVQSGGVPAGGIQANTVTTSMLQANSVNSQIIAAGSVTSSQLAANAANANITTGSLYPSQFAYPKTYSTPTVTNTGATSYEYNNIPNWANRITIMFWNVSGSGTSIMKIQVGNSSNWVTGTVYYHEAQYASPGSSSGVDTGFSLQQTVAAADRSDGKMVLDRFALSGSANSNVWTAINGVECEGQAASGGGCVDVGTELTRLRLIATNGTDTFDSGQFNIVYEP